jgi:hypothetical protein
MIKKNIANIIIPVISILTLLLISYWLLFPENDENGDFITFKNNTLPYHMVYPEKTIELPWKLSEISGISYYKGNEIACIEDESGKIYILNYETGEITGIHKFGKNRDYEDITVMMDLVEDNIMKIYVLRSTGKIYRIKRLGLPAQKVKKYDTSLTKHNDAEGLCYYKELNSLLIASKHSPRLNKQWHTVEEKKAIYIFDLNKHALLPDPLFVLDLSMIRDAAGNIIHSNKKFQPSGIAVHPISRNIYIISSVGNLLLVVNKKGEIQSLITLNKALFLQPEGICFLPDGDMLISNEGRKGRGTILRFKYNK